jgi:hypothetical protein
VQSEYCNIGEEKLVVCEIKKCSKNLNTGINIIYDKKFRFDY